jgi:DNA-binding MarR family transcriptional regulator
MADEQEDAAVRWLDDSEQDVWVSFVPMMLRLQLELDRQLQRDSGLSLMEYFVLSGLSEHPGHTMRMSWIAAWTGAQLPRLSQMAARMEARGWIQRRPDPSDGRATLATLTPEGLAVLREAAPDHVRQVRRLVFDPLTRAEATKLGAISTKIMHAVSPDETFTRPAR